MPTQTPDPNAVLYVVLAGSLFVLFVITSFLLANWFKTNNANSKENSLKLDKAIDMLTSIKIELARQDKDILYLKELYVGITKRLDLHGGRIGHLERENRGNDNE
jgi:hypothetical protein